MDESLQQRLLKDLVVESTEALDQFDRDLLSMEGGTSDGETLNRVFRAIHSLKGTSGCLGLKKIERLSHAGEDLLSAVREGRLAPDEAVIAALFAFGDALRSMIASLESSGEEGGEAHEALLSTLHSLQLKALDCGVRTEAPRAGLFADEEPALQREQPAPHQESDHAPGAASVRAAPLAADSAIRVNVGQLDGLMDLVGELVLARNQILQHSGSSRETAFVSSTQRLNIITTRLQESVMKTRLQPIENIWAKYPRIVRDMAHQLDKEVSLDLEGKETELDRKILDAIKDPLIHLLRNAIDHGIETPERRERAGKPREGRVRLRAFHEGGQVIIELRDDGAGIDRQRVIEEAAARGLIRATDAERLDDSEVFALLFLPGFSTAKAVTNVSGRGVGLDVVKQNIEGIGGAVTVESEPGVSTTVRLKIPLTLAIIPALIIRCGGLRFAIPQASLIELVRIDADQKPGIEYVNEAAVYRLRGNLLPLVSLRKELRLEQAPKQDATCIFLLVLQAEGRQFGLVVDSILDTEEIVVKPLGRELKSLSIYAGATIMGDGSVALILDVMGLARRANLLRENRSAAGKERASAGSNAHGYLLVRLGDAAQAAIDLVSVARLEEFPPSAIERSAGGSVVQYRGEIMPLVFVAQTLGEKAEALRDESMKVVVYSLNSRNYGLVVERIEDIVESEARIESSSRPGLQGCGILANRVTDFLDVAALVRLSGVAL